jgi:SAM-dependent methyltransferase
MFKKLLHRVATHPWVYDRIQSFFGLSHTQALLRERLFFVQPVAYILDIGGGTGLYRSCLPDTVRYVCIDIESAKLQGFHARYPGEDALLADGLHLPVKSGTVDAVMCIAVSHHIPNQHLEQLFSEGMRVLKPTGSFIFLDAVWDRTRPVGRLIWAYDRGSFPRSPEVLRAALAAHGDITHWESYAIYHRYILALVRNRG